MYLKRDRVFPTQTPKKIKEIGISLSILHNTGVRFKMLHPRTIPAHTDPIPKIIIGTLVAHPHPPPHSVAEQTPLLPTKANDMILKLYAVVNPTPTKYANINTKLESIL